MPSIVMPSTVRSMVLGFLVGSSLNDPSLVSSTRVTVNLSSLMVSLMVLMISSGSFSPPFSADSATQVPWRRSWSSLPFAFSWAAAGAVRPADSTASAIRPAAARLNWGGTMARVAPCAGTTDWPTTERRARLPGLAASPRPGPDGGGGSKGGRGRGHSTSFFAGRRRALRRHRVLYYTDAGAG